MLTLECGCDTNMELEDALADEHIVVELAKTDSRKRGYRLRNYESVPNLTCVGLDGLYDYSRATGICGHNFTGDEFDFSTKVQKDIVSKLAVFMNWTEYGAVLKDPNGKYKFVLASLFPNKFVDEAEGGENLKKKRSVGKQPVSMQRTIIDARACTPPARTRPRSG